MPAEKRENLCPSEKIKKGPVTMEATELRLTRWVRFGPVSLGLRGREKKKLQPEGIANKGLRSDDVCKNTNRLPC